ncbi:ABC transporter ATP-binding protein [Amnibacterium sp.]|uniref:ABC transporter ATP-binding protein n=1 Tax=Amnibacterium sp. TaxID=1872496 RepID=UPI00263795E7|nr:ABC transporter ATP-binding protein [Amnibacterium sp.]MCU1472410.1 ABC-type spermidine/putrescine transport system, ATPase component [Amnibacterium sp.]
MAQVAARRDVRDADPATPGIALEGVRKTFGSVVAVDRVDLEIADGELFAMLGPSGSGKTTVLRMIAGFEQPTEGRIRLAGIDSTDLPPHRRDVNTVFQDYALFPHLSVQQNVEYGLTVRGIGRAERIRRAGEALDMVRLAGVGARRPDELSGGQRQRVALARALVVRPRVLLLDEPLGALDLKLREQMQVELKAIQREVGITFVFVTHDQDEALTLCDRLAVFNAGRIEQVGAAADVYERPQTRFVAGFVGTSNVLDGAAAAALVGRPGVFGIRPEKLEVLPAGTAAGGGLRSTEGTVAEVVYAGSTTRLIVDTDAGAALSVVQLNADTGPAALRRGDRAVVAWHPESVRTLESASPTPPPEGSA